MRDWGTVVVVFRTGRYCYADLKQQDTMEVQHPKQNVQAGCLILLLQVKNMLVILTSGNINAVNVNDPICKNIHL